MADIHIDARKLAKLLQSIGLNHGFVLGPTSRTLTPLHLQKAAGGSEFSHGVLACIAEIAQLFEQPGACGRGLAQALDHAKPEVVLRKDPNQPPVPLHQRLIHARNWLLGKAMRPAHLREMNADPWYVWPHQNEHMAVSVAATLRELADQIEKHGIELGLAEPLLIDQVLDEQAQQAHGAVGGEAGA